MTVGELKAELAKAEDQMEVGAWDENEKWCPLEAAEVGHASPRKVELCISIVDVDERLNRIKEICNE